MKTDLVSILTQEGHSGAIQGFCKIIYPKYPNSQEEYDSIGSFHDAVCDGTEKNKYFHGIFSSGIIPLGKHCLEIILRKGFSKKTYIPCKLKLENREDVQIFIELIYPEDEEFFIEGSVFKFNAVFTDILEEEGNVK